MAVVGCGPKGEGYEIKQGKEWVTKHAVLISRSMFVVRLALAAGRAAVYQSLHTRSCVLRVTTLLAHGPARRRAHRHAARHLPLVLSPLSPSYLWSAALDKSIK